MNFGLKQATGVTVGKFDNITYFYKKIWSGLWGRILTFALNNFHLLCLSFICTLRYIISRSRNKIGEKNGA
jgi:hypothetical protein